MIKKAILNTLFFGALTFSGILIEELVTNDFCISKQAFWLHGVIGSIVAMLLWGLITFYILRNREKRNKP